MLMTFKIIGTGRVRITGTGRVITGDARIMDLSPWSVCPRDPSAAIKNYLSPIIFRPHREVHPIGCAPFLEYELVELSPSAIGDIQQYRRHADHHLRPIAVDIHRATSQVVTPLLQNRSHFWVSTIPTNIQPSWSWNLIAQVSHFPTFPLLTF